MAVTAAEWIRQKAPVESVAVTDRHSDNAAAGLISFTVSALTNVSTLYRVS